MGKATRRLSLKTIAMLFPTGSIERVYLHGTWQQERGRGPSMLFGNHHSTRAAYAAASDMVGQYFDEIRRQHGSRLDFFWTEDMLFAIQDRVPVSNLPLPSSYR